MESFEQKNKSELKIETIKTPEDGEISFCADRGGIITSVKLHDKEILYLDNETFNNTDVSVKGGIPILFPNAGPIPDELKINDLKDLKQHGFARDSKWTSEKKEDGFTETLISDEETKKLYPYDFKLEVDGSFKEDGSFSLTQTIENLEKDKEIPVSTGLHPYFKVPNEEKKNIKFNFKDGKKVEEQIEKWLNGEAIKAISIENPNTPLEIEIPNLGTLVLNISETYKRVWVWTMEGKDFICIEPVMRDKGGIITDPEIIKAGEKNISTVNISLKQI